MSAHDHPNIGLARIERNLRQEPTPEAVRRLWAESGAQKGWVYSMEPDAGEVRVNIMRTLEPVVWRLGPSRVPDLRWHLSVGLPDRLPSWDELRDARYLALPHELMFAQLFPPPGEYLNVHPFVLHLWQIPRLEVR